MTGSLGGGTGGAPQQRGSSQAQQQAIVISPDYFKVRRRRSELREGGHFPYICLGDRCFAIVLTSLTSVFLID